MMECSSHMALYIFRSRKNHVYDDDGLLLADGRDICDCLDNHCPGCHFPCLRCKSPKCGADCRCNRKWVYQEVEVEGAGHKLVFDGGIHLT